MRGALFIHSPVFWVLGLALLAKGIYSLTPMGRLAQANYELCKKSIIAGMPYPDSYNHNKRLDSRIVESNGDGWNVLVDYDAMDEHGAEKYWRAVCYIEDGGVESVSIKFIRLS